MRMRASPTAAMAALVLGCLLTLFLDGVQGQSWEGWSTQTQFGCGDPTWPYEPGSGKTTLILADLQPLQDGKCDNGNNAYSTFGAALPWRYVCKQYGSRDAYVQAVYDAWYGTSTAPVCFEVQPINRVPASISDGSYDQPSLATTPNPASINSDEIVAKQQNGAPYPKFQLVPFEGCGGNCVWQPGTPQEGQSTEDCYNSCYGVAGQNQGAALQCDFAWAANDPTCIGMYTLWGGGSWPNSGGSFWNYSAPYAINYDADFPTQLNACEKPSNQKGEWYRTTPAQSECVFANWCNGINMHHDWTFSGVAPWGGLNYAPYPNPQDPDAAGPATQFGGDPTYEQIMFRYRHVPCRNWHDTLGVGMPYPNVVQCIQGCRGDRRCIKRCRSTCNANCKRYATDLERVNCTAFTGAARTKCKYRAKAFQFGCQSVCAEPVSA